MAMKHILAFTAFIALLAFAFTGQVSAATEADGTASLLAHASDKDTRATKLGTYLAAHDSPLAAVASHFVAEADRLNIDWKLVPAIAGLESTFGKQIPTYSYNAWGWGVFTGKQSGVYFKDWKDGITKVSEGLKYNYIEKGAVTIDQIGRIYAASPTWAYRVRYLMNDIAVFTPNRPDLIEVTL